MAKKKAAFRHRDAKTGREVRAVREEVSHYNSHEERE